MRFKNVSDSPRLTIICLGVWELSILEYSEKIIRRHSLETETGQGIRRRRLEEGV